MFTIYTYTWSPRTTLEPNILFISFSAFRNLKCTYTHVYELYCFLPLTSCSLTYIHVHVPSVHLEQRVVWEWSLASSTLSLPSSLLPVCVSQQSVHFPYCSIHLISVLMCREWRNIFEPSPFITMSDTCCRQPCYWIAIVAKKIKYIHTVHVLYLIR